VILVDSSAWIEFLRASGHPAHQTVKHHLTRSTPIATTEPIVMELLAGATATRDLARLRSRLRSVTLLRLRGLPDFEKAADLYRGCRRSGETVRRLIDCLIAAVAIRERATLLHNDRDFETLARHSKLRIEPYVGERNGGRSAIRHQPRTTRY
jgi:predicted nucleic acid-binding protein